MECSVDKKNQLLWHWFFFLLMIYLYLLSSVVSSHNALTILNEQANRMPSNQIKYHIVNMSLIE